MQEVTTLYRFGFCYKGVPYGWKDKKLYKLPYTKNKISYSLKEIPSYCFNSTTIFNIQRTKKSLKFLKQITIEINYKIISYDNSMPF